MPRKRHPRVDAGPRLALVALAACWISSLSVGMAAAGGPIYSEFHLGCRANFTGAFQLPDAAFFTNATPALNDAGQLAIYLTVLDAGADTRGVFMDDGTTAGVVYTGPAGAFLGDVSLGPQGRLVFQQTFAAIDGIYFYDAGDGTSGLLTTEPFGASTWGSPQINGSGQVGLRASFFAGQAYASWGGGSATIHAAEAGLDPSSPYSFLFTPSFDGQRRIAGKVRLGQSGQIGSDRPDEIRIFATDGSSVLIAEDDDGNPASPFSGFDNSVSLTDSGWVAFVAFTVSGGRGVFLSNGVETRTIALEGDPGVSEIEFFSPAANDDGLVAFRGKDDQNLQAIFAGDGGSLVRVIGEHDLVETDLGTARLDQNDSSPIFGGGPAINARGDIAFAAGLTPPDNDQIEWGSGLFVARRADSIFVDRFESGDLLAWSSSFP
ncbi:MAG: hypothetical protein AAGN66_15835 [Acidobacteriota bacterium]